MLDELDFRKEAKNIKDFTDFLEVEGITDAAAPKVCSCICVSVRETSSLFPRGGYFFIEKKWRPSI